MKDLRGFKIHCDNDEEKKELLEEATKQGFKWYSGSRPLEWPNALIVNYYSFFGDMRISQGTLDTCISYKEYKAMSVFTKADLKPCMVVEIEHMGDKSLSMVCTNSRNELCVSGKEFYSPLERFDNNMIYGDDAIINRVFGFCNNNRDAHKLSTMDRPLLWERKEETEISVADAEKELSKLSGKKYKIVKE